MRARLSSLTLADVNDALRRHLSYTDLSFVAVTQDADALRAALLSRAPPPSPTTPRSPHPY